MKKLIITDLGSRTSDEKRECMGYDNDLLIICLLFIFFTSVCTWAPFIHLSSLVHLLHHFPTLHITLMFCIPVHAFPMLLLPFNRVNQHLSVDLCFSCIFFRVKHSCFCKYSDLQNCYNVWYFFSVHIIVPVRMGITLYVGDIGEPTPGYT